MKGNRKQYKLEEVAEVFTGFPFKGDKYHDSEGTKVVRGENVTIGNLRWDTVKYWNEEFDEFEKYALDEGDIVIGMDGSRVGKNRAQIKANDLPLLLAQRVARIRAKKNFDQDFLAHIIKSDVFESYVKAVHTGTSIPHISGTQLKEFKFQSTSDSKEQKQIATILSSLDNKIELNLQMNQTLEAMAQAIFEEWFVNFNFPGSKGKLIDSLPKGWRMGKLSEVLEIKYGKDYKHLTNGNIPLYGSGGIMKYVDAAIYDRESILIPRKGTLSNLFYTNKPFWSVDTMFYTKIKAEAAGKYLFYLLKTLDLESMNVGSAVPSLTTEVLNNLLIQIPSIEILKQFEVLVTSMHEKLESNIIENQVLSDIRDSILPKLMTGKIEVKE